MTGRYVLVTKRGGKTISGKLVNPSDFTFGAGWVVVLSHGVAEYIPKTSIDNIVFTQRTGEPVKEVDDED